MSSSMLVVDDNAGIRDMFSEHFSNDMQVFQAESHDQALDYLEQDIIDILVLDSELRTECGWELLRMVKDPDNWPQLPVIFMSLCPEPESALKAWSYSGGLGIYYVVKPFAPLEVFALIRNVILCPH